MKDILIYVFISFLLSCLGLYYKIYLFIIPLLYIYRLIYKHDRKYLFVVILFTVVFCKYFEQSLKVKIPNNKIYTVKKASQYNYEIQNNEATVILKTPSQLNVDDILKIDTPLTKISTLENFNLFSFENYLKSSGIFYETKSKNPFIIKKAVKKNKENKVSDYFNYLFLMDKNGIDDKIIESLKDLALVHLVVVSGFHFNIFYKILELFFLWIKHNNLRKVIVLLCLFYYLVQINFAYPALRALLCILISSTFLKDKISKLNICALSGLLIILYNPLALLSNSFLLTFYISLLINVIPLKIKRNMITFNIVIVLASIPFTTAMNYQVSLLSFIYPIIFTPIILFLYTITFFTKIFSFSTPLCLIVINLFEKLVVELSKYNITVNTGYLPIYLCILYFILFSYCLHKSNEKKLYLSCPLIVIVLYSLLPNVNGTITYLNVGQGDCIIIIPPFSKEAMMIDVAQSYKEKNVDRIIIPYLKSMKVNSIAKLVITHSDADHAGGKDDLVKNFPVKEVITKKQKIIKFNDYTFIDLLANSKFKDVNRNSITLYTRINSLNYLFTGDIDAEAEQEFERYVTKLPVDILKLAHHGSKTSTSADFIALTNPKIAVAQVKKNNRYKHPHPIVTTRLKERNIKLYTTADNGTVSIVYNPFFNYLKTYK